MLDYWKLWIYDKPLVEQVLSSKELAKYFEVDEAGTIRGTNGRYGEWQMQTLQCGHLQITGSLHKYWNGGTNENDFTFPDVYRAIASFCSSFDLPAEQLFVKNLEFGLNLQPEIDASTFLSQVICFQRTLPMQPYQNKKDCYFIEFSLTDYFLKVYDKGKQYRKRVPGTPNTLRVEVKAMNSGYLKALGVETVADLMKREVLLTLAEKLQKTLQGLILDDSTVKVQQLPIHERKLYSELTNPRKWNCHKKSTTSTHRYRANRFRQIVEQRGERKIYSLFERLIREKVEQLSENPNLALFHPNIYLENRQMRA